MIRDDLMIRPTPEVMESEHYYKHSYIIYVTSIIDHIDYWADVVF